MIAVAAGMARFVAAISVRVSSTTIVTSGRLTAATVVTAAGAAAGTPRLTAVPAVESPVMMTAAGSAVRLARIAARIARFGFARRHTVLNHFVSRFGHRFGTFFFDRFLSVLRSRRSRNFFRHFFVFRFFRNHRFLSHRFLGHDRHGRRRGVGISQDSAASIGRRRGEGTRAKDSQNEQEPHCDTFFHHFNPSIKRLLWIIWAAR